MVGYVIYTTYLNFENHKVKGLFYIIYDESLDNNVAEKYNLTGIKITSQNKDNNFYAVKLTSNFFDKTSYCMCTKVHTFRKFSGEITVLGRLNNTDITNINNKYKIYSNELERQNII